jgi:aspartyl-tRNA(Asn)/glutamyl-tRNA(Gln) amidotransferase subunit C
MEEAEFNHLLKLCKIECTDDERNELRGSINNVLEYVEQLKEINTDSTPSCNFVLGALVNNHFREDSVNDLLKRESFLENAPEKIGGMIRVPTILKGSL